MKDDERFGIDEYRLCLVKYGTAWFTTRAVEEQWGDDWNDAPWFYNAGAPYTWSAERDGVHLGLPEWDIVQVKYEGPFQTDEVYHPGLSLSAWDYNKGARPWITTDWIARTHAAVPSVEIWAGCMLPEFMDLVEVVGGTVYLPFALAVQLVKGTLG